jgi:hypothetical protein
VWRPPARGHGAPTLTRPLLRRSVSARVQEDKGVARLGVWGARGCYGDQGAFGVDKEQQVGRRGDPPSDDWVVMRASAV